MKVNKLNKTAGRKVKVNKLNKTAGRKAKVNKGKSGEPRSCLSVDEEIL